MQACPSDSPNRNSTTSAFEAAYQLSQVVALHNLQRLQCDLSPGWWDSNIDIKHINLFSPEISFLSFASDQMLLAFLHVEMTCTISGSFRWSLQPAGLVSPRRKFIKNARPLPDNIEPIFPLSRCPSAVIGVHVASSRESGPFRPYGLADQPYLGTTSRVKFSDKAFSDPMT